MPSEVTVEIVPSELAQIVESVFVTMLGVEVSECQTPWFASADRLTSSVHLTGHWNGAVLFECDPRQACRFAGRFLAMMSPESQVASAPAPPVVDDVVRDLIGELANMIGGNLKCVLTQGVRLSMPSVVDGTEYSLRVCGAQVKERLSFDCVEGVFWITVLVTRPI
jgi:chemotaxis protein CheX